MITRISGVSLSLAALGAVLLTGCHRTPPAETQPAVAFERPADGASIRLADDEDPTQPGIQYTVEARIENVSSDAQATLSVNGAAAATQALHVVGTTAEVSFARVTLPGGAVTLKLQVDDAGTGKHGSATLSLHVETGGCTFSKPVDGTTLSASDDVDPAQPGVQTTVAVQCQGVPAGDTATLELAVVLGANRQDLLPLTATIDATGAATFEKVSLGEGKNVLGFRVTSPSGAEDGSAQGTVFVSTGACPVVLGNRNDVIFNAAGAAPPAASELRAVIADADPANAGIQEDLLAYTDPARCPAGSVAELFFDGTSLATATVGGDGTIRFAHATLPDGDPVHETVKVTAGAASGQSLPNVYGVDSVVPQLAITQPSKATLTQFDDLDPGTPGLQTRLQLRASRGIDPATILEIDDAANGASAVLIAGSTGYQPDVGTGLLDFAQPVTLPSGTNVLTAKATRRLGNVGTAVFTTNVTESSLVISLLAPATASVTCTHAPGDTTDEDPSTTDCDLNMKVQVDPSATAVDFAGSGPSPVTGGQMAVAPDASHQAYAQFHIPQGDGYVLTATAHDALGATRSVSVAVSVHTIGATVRFTSPDHSTTVLTGQTQDVSLALTGAQVGEQVKLFSSIASGGGQVAIGSVSSIDASGGATVTLSGVNLPLGCQTLTAVVADSYGNASTDTVTLTVITNGMCDLTVAGGSPQVFNLAGTRASTDGGAQRSATLGGSTTLCKGLAVTVSKVVGGTSTPVATLATDGSTGAFAGDIAFDDNEVDATLAFSIGTGAQAFTSSLIYTADFTPPSLDALLPAAGQLLVVPSGDPRGAPYVADEDATAAGGQVTPTITVSGAGRLGAIAETGVGALTISGVGVNAGIAAITSQSPQTYNNQLSFADGMARDVTITATDAAGNSTTATWSVAVASQPLPALTLLDPSGTLNVFSDLKPFHPDHIDFHGYVTFAAQVLPGTDVYLCSTTPAPGSSRSCVEASPAGSVAPGSEVTYGIDGGAPPASSLFAADVVWPEGSYQVFAEAVSAVGDHVDSPAKSLVVDSVPPRVTALSISEDANHDGLLNAAELAASSGVAHLVATFTGVEPGRTATLHDGAATYTASVSGDLTSSTATFAVSGLGDGSTHAFKVTVTDAAGNPNETSAVSPPITNPEDALTVRIATGAPSVAVLSPTFKVCNLANGADANSKTCRLNFTVGVGAQPGLAVTEVDFSGPGAPANAAVVPSNGIASASYAVPEGAAQTLSALVRDSAGNTATAQVTLLVDATPPDLTIASPTGGSHDGQDFIVTVTTTASDVGSVTITSSATQPPRQSIGSASFINGSAQVSVHAPVGSNETLTAVATDLAGNPGTSAPVSLTVTQQGCDVTFTNPAGASVTLNQSSPGQNTFTVQGYSTQCPNTAVTYYVAVGSAGEATLGSGTTDASGHFSEQVTFQDSAVTRFRAEMVGAGVTNSASFDATVDVTAPSIVINSPTAGSSGTLYVVAQSGNRHVAAGEPGYVADASPINGGQVNLDLTITGGGSITGSGSGTLVVSDASGNVLASESIGSNGTVSFSPGGTPLQITLPQAYQGPVSFTVTDAAGNATTASWSSVLVDVVPPPAPMLITSDPGDGGFTHVVNERHADLVVSFIKPVDDGLPNTDVTLELGYSTSTRLDGGVYDEAAYENSAVTTLVPVSAAAVVNASLSAVPPLNTYYLAPRAIDAVGNVSVLAPGSLDVNWSRETIAYPGQSSTAALFGAQVAVGDFDHDGKADIAVYAQGENNYAGSVTVFYGGSLPLTRTQRFTGTGSSVRGIAVGDLNNDQYSDLVLVANDHIEAYLGGAAGLASAPSFSVTGDSGVRVAAVVSDLNHDGIQDLVVTAPFSNVGGTAYILYGRTSWSAFGGTVASADVTITESTSSSYLGGLTRGIATVPDIDGDGYAELYLGEPGQKRGLLFLGKQLDTIRLGTAAAFSPKIIAPAAAVSLFGDSAVALDMNGDNAVDLVCGQIAAATQTFVSYQDSSNEFGIATPFISGSNALGRSLFAGDLNGDGVSDLGIGMTGSGPGQLFFVISEASSLGTAPNAELFGASGFGASVAAGDVDGDGLVDLVVGEPGNANGNVYVIH